MDKLHAPSFPCVGSLVGASRYPHPLPLSLSPQRCSVPVWLLASCLHCPALCPGVPGPAGAAGVREGVTAAREEDSGALSMRSSPPYHTFPKYGREDPHVAAPRPGFCPHSASTCAPAYVTLEDGAARALPWIRRAWMGNMSQLELRGWPRITLGAAPLLQILLLPLFESGD